MVDGDVASLENDGAYIASLSKPSALLPIARYRKELLYTVETNPVTVLIGQTGSGKTTQLPQFLEQAGWCADGKVIAVTQVRKSVFSRKGNKSHPLCIRVIWVRVLDMLMIDSYHVAAPSCCYISSASSSFRASLCRWTRDWLLDTLRRCHVGENEDQIPH